MHSNHSEGGQLEYLTRKRAAEYLAAKGLPINEQSLADAAYVGRGPLYKILRGRAIYTIESLNRWVDEAARPIRQQRKSSQAARPIKRRRAAEAAA
jgi:hypothetical protein